MNAQSKFSLIICRLTKTYLFLVLAKSYLEPGSSSFLLKILISSLVGFVVFFRQIWGYVRAVLGKVTGKKPEPVTQDKAGVDLPAKNELQ